MESYFARARLLVTMLSPVLYLRRSAFQAPEMLLLEKQVPQNLDKLSLGAIAPSELTNLINIVSFAYLTRLVQRQTPELRLRKLRCVINKSGMLKKMNSSVLFRFYVYRHVLLRSRERIDVLFDFFNEPMLDQNDQRVSSSISSFSSLRNCFSQFQ